MCLYPKLIKNRKYIANKKNGGVIPAISDKRVLLVPVGCGKCMECKKQKGREWSVRLQEEIRHRKDGQFVTLTFSNESIAELSEGIELTGYNLDNEICTKAMRRFLERWRKKHKKSVRHWMVTEIGGNRYEGIHMHGIIFTDKKEDIETIWKYGHVFIGTHVNEATINYIVKYINKTDEKHKEYNSKILTSNGIGKGYTKRADIQNNKYNGKKTNETYKTRQGMKLALPIYYRNKIYTDEEKEKLWLQKLDEEVRYVNGRKVDISKGEEGYYRVLAEERAKNKRLGYGNDEINWEKRKYENERRNLKIMERIKKVEFGGDGTPTAEFFNDHKQKAGSELVSYKASTDEAFEK